MCPDVCTGLSIDRKYISAPKDLFEFVVQRTGFEDGHVAEHLGHVGLLLVR